MRNVRNIDRGWRFFRGDLAPHTNTEGWGGGKGKSFYFGATAMDMEDGGWREVNLPHDFVMEGDYTRKKEIFVGADKVPDMEAIDSRHFAGGSLEGGIAWYRKKLEIPAKEEGKRFFLTFEGVFRNSTVYVNEHFVGTHESGYTGFTYDISEYIVCGEENLIAVRVDSTGREGWWYEGGGIYRHVWLTSTEPLYVPEDGVYVMAEPELETGRAHVVIETELESRLEEKTEVCICSVILDEEGKEAARLTDKAAVDFWDHAKIRQELTLTHAILWNLDNPYQYRLKTSILLNGVETDCKETLFGIRKIEVDRDKGLFLNGSFVKIKGFCLHMDHAGVGIAVTDKLMEYRLLKMKELGANAVRCSHNPFAPKFLELCDKMGILVMDETRKTSTSVENLKQLRDMVRRDRNHPCIYCWCVGNEEVNLQFTKEAKNVVRAMCMEVRRLDRTRPITMALVYWNPNAGKNAKEIDAGELEPIAKYLDIAGFNYNADKWDPYHKLAPHQAMMNTEATSGGFTRSCYDTNPEAGQYYLMDLENSNKGVKRWTRESMYQAQNMWKMYNERDYLAGYFLWTAFDYRGEPTPMPYPAVSSQWGLMDTCGFEKDIAYYFKSWWTDKEVLHLFPDWNLTGREGQPVTVYCYSNMEEVELFVNGKSYGRQRMEKDWFLTWEDVIYEPGILCAVGYRNGVEVRREEVRTVTAAASIELCAFEPVMKAGKTATAIINIRLLDKDGNLAVTSDAQISFTIKGEGRFLGTGNGNPGSQESDKRPVRRAFHGLCQLLVETTGEPGEIVVTAASEGIGTGKCRITLS